MAGIFGLFDFTKEGPGIDRDEPEKGPIAEFFSIVGTKFWKLVTVNLMMLLFQLPGLALSFIIVNWLMPNLFPGFAYENLLKAIRSLNITFAEGVTADAYASHLFLSMVMIFTFAMVGLQFFVLGPVHAGFTYLMRNFARREPCFIWMDFRDTIKANWKQSLIHSIISTVIFVLMALAFHYYGLILQKSLLSTLLRSILLICIIVYTIMQFYIYQLMITFELSLKDIYKNALLFTFVRLPSNVGVLALCLLLLAVIPFMAIWFIPSALSTLIVFLLFCLLLLSFTLLIINFQAHRAIYKYMLKPIYDQKHAEEQARIEAEDSSWAEDEDEEEDESAEEEEEQEAEADAGLPSHSPA